MELEHSSANVLIKRPQQKKLSISTTNIFDLNTGQLTVRSLQTPYCVLQHETIYATDITYDRIQQVSNTTILTKNIFMPQHHCLVNLRLPKPRSFLRRKKNLDSNVLIAPFPLPHFAVSAFPDAANERYLFGYCSLNLEPSLTFHVMQNAKIWHWHA